MQEYIKPNFSEVVQSNFCFGELNPNFKINSDTEQYEISLAKLENFIVNSSGKIETRPPVVAVKKIEGDISKGRIFPVLLEGDVWGVLLVQETFINIYMGGNLVNYRNIKLASDLYFTREQLDILSFVQTASLGYLAARGHEVIFFNLDGEKEEELGSENVLQFGKGSNDRDDMPSKLAIFSDRLWCASSILNPSKWWVSNVTGHLDPKKDSEHLFSTTFEKKGSLYARPLVTATKLETISEAFWFMHSAEYPSYVKWILPNKYLNFSTGYKEYSVRPVDVSSILSSQNIKILDETNIGSAEIDPILIDNEVIFVDSSRRKLFLLIAETAQHSIQKAIEVSYFSNHLFEKSRIKKIVYQKNPIGIIWVLLEDGNLVSLTYNSQQKILGWARQNITFCHILDMVVFQSSTGEDVVLFLLKKQKSREYFFAKLESFLVNDFKNYKDMGEYSIHCVMKTHNFLKDQEKKAQRLFSAQIQKLGIYTNTEKPIGKINGVKIDPQNEKDGYVEVQAPRHYTKSVEITYEVEAIKKMTITGVHAIFSKKITN